MAGPPRNPLFEVWRALGDPHRLQGTGGPCGLQVVNFLVLRILIVAIAQK